MLNTSNHNSPRDEVSLLFSEVNAPNPFVSKMQSISGSFERNLKQEFKELRLSKNEISEALHEVRRAGKAAGYELGREWNGICNQRFSEFVEANQKIVSLVRTADTSQHLLQDLRGLYQSYFELGASQRREGDLIATDLYTCLRGVEVNFGEVMAIVESVDPADRMALCVTPYRKAQGISLIDDLQRAYTNPIRKIFHWWNKRSPELEAAEVKAALEGSIEGSIEALAYRLARAVPEKKKFFKGSTNVELVASVFRTIPSAWRPKVEALFCEMRSIEPSQMQAYILERTAKSDRDVVGAMLGPESKNLARIDAFNLLPTVNRRWPNFHGLGEAFATMSKSDLNRVINELDKLLVDTKVGSLDDLFNKYSTRLGRCPFYDRARYLYRAAKTNNLDDFYKSEAARFRAALKKPKSSNEFIAAVFLEKEPVERRLVASAYQEIYGQSIEESVSKGWFGKLKPLQRELLSYAMDPAKDDDKGLLKVSGIPVALLFADVFEGLGTHELGLFELLKSLSREEIVKVVEDYNSELNYSFKQWAGVSLFSSLSKSLFEKDWGPSPIQDLEELHPRKTGRNLVRDSFAELDGGDLLVAVQMFDGKDRDNQQKIQDLEVLIDVVRSPKLAWYVDRYTREGKNLEQDLLALKDYHKNVSAHGPLTETQQEHFDFLEGSIRSSLQSYRKTSANTAFQSANWMAIGAVTASAFICGSLGTGFWMGILVSGTIATAVTFAARFGISRLVNGKSHGRESVMWDLGLSMIEGYTLKIGFLARYIGPLGRGILGPLMLKAINSPIGRKLAASLVKGGIKFGFRKRVLGTLSSSQNNESKYVNYLYRLMSEERRNRHRSTAASIAEQILMYGS